MRQKQSISRQVHVWLESTITSHVPMQSLEMLVDDYLQPLQIGSIISKDEVN